MEDICKIGLAYFANLSQDDKKLADNFFNKMFGFRVEIGFNEYLDFVKSEKLPLKIANYDCFNVLDVDQNGSLNLEEAKPLYYISKNKIIACDVCHVWLTGSFFSCFQCFSGQSSDTFDLCRDCYEGGSFRHHDGHFFYDNQNLLFNRKTSRQREKSELQLTAEAYYQNVTPTIKAEADKFFREMDKDENNKIGIDEYISHMKQRGYEKMANFELFMELNRSGSGQLDFMEVMTLYYIIQSRRPFCDGCNIFMGGLFFTCNECFNGEDDKTFDICPSCFKTKNYKHQHNHFVDNYALLESKRIEALMEKKRQRRNEITNYEESYAQAQPTTSTSTTLVPYDRRQKINHWFSVTSSLLGIVSSVTGIISNCSIM